MAVAIFMSIVFEEAEAEECMKIIHKIHHSNNSHNRKPLTRISRCSSFKSIATPIDMEAKRLQGGNNHTNACGE